MRRKFRELNPTIGTPTLEGVHRPTDRRYFEQLTAGIRGGELGTCTTAVFGRMQRIDSFLDSADKNWALVSGAFSQYWKFEILAGDAVGDYDIQGFRSLTHCPIVDDEDWAPVNASTGGTAPYYHPFSNTTQPDSISPYLNVCKSTHFAQGAVAKIIPPVVFVSGTQDVTLKLVQFRIIENGVPKSIIDGEDTTAVYSNQFGTYWQPVFTLPTTFNFKRNVVYGIDTWLKATKSSAGHTMTGNVGSSTSAVGTRTDVGHIGQIGFQLSANPTWSPTAHTYELTFAGGSFRPFSETTSRFLDSDFPANNSGSITNCNASRLNFSTNNSMLIEWRREIPYIRLVNAGVSTMYYVPQDDSNYLQTYNYMNAAGTERRYAWVERPGGLWDGVGPHTFVPFFTPQNNNTGTFTPTSLAISWPTSIVVERVNQ